MKLLGIINHAMASAAVVVLAASTAPTTATAADALPDQGVCATGTMIQCREQVFKAVHRAKVHASIAAWILDRRDLESRFIRIRWLSDDALEVTGFVPTHSAATALRDATARYAAPATTRVNLMLTPEITNKANRNTWVSEAADDLIIHGRIATALLSPAARPWLSHASLQVIVVREGRTTICIIEDGPLPDRVRRLRPHLAVPGVKELKIFVLENFDKSGASSEAGNQ